MILFVDDEERRMDSYVEELIRSGYNVIFKKDVDQAFDFFENNHEKIELLILDIMMPAGEHFEEVDTNYGLITGIKFYEEVRQDFIDIPIIVFTNMFDDKIEEKILNDSKAKLLHKEDLLPLDFVSRVKSFIGKK